MANRPNPYYTAGKLADADFRRRRARKAGQASQSIDSYIRRIVARWPELTPEQKDKLATLLHGAPAEHQAGGDLDDAA